MVEKNSRALSLTVQDIFSEHAWVESTNECIAFSLKKKVYVK